MKRTAKRLALWAGGILAAGWLISLIPHTTPPPDNINNACLIFQQYPRWYVDLAKAEQHWHLPIAVSLAIIRQESHFHALAQTPHRHLLGIPLPWTHITTATGYTQAIDGTWKLYENATHNYWNDRSSFASAADFIGWFAANAHHRAGIPLNDAYDLYLAYHEGIRGYIEHNYDRKLWLKNIAWLVQRHAETYQHQLRQCRHNYSSLHWWHYW